MEQINTCKDVANVHIQLPGLQYFVIVYILEQWKLNIESIKYVLSFYQPRHLFYFAVQVNMITQV